QNETLTTRSHSHILLLIPERRVERTWTGLARLVPRPGQVAFERFCSSARISARRNNSGERERATRRSGARSALEHIFNYALAFVEYQLF
ncbi:MAG: hypothetical protein V2A61_07395, partial [Calditrichota bacterium]